MDNIIDNQIDEIYRQQDNADSGNDHYRGMKRRIESINHGNKTKSNRRNNKIAAKRTCQEIAAELEKKSVTSENRRKPFSARLRYETLVKYNSTCLLCGATPGNGVKIDVDHIKPVSKYPELANDPDNLQLLCQKCNIGKFNRSEEDFRPDTP